MRKLLFLLLTLMTTLLSAEAAEARSRRLGLGVVIAGPTGITGQYFYGKGKDVSAALGWGQNSYHLNIDHHWNNRNWLKADGVSIAVYYGIGLRLISWDGAHDSGSNAGVRFPFGVQHIFKPVGIQIFFELAPAIIVIDHSSFTIDLALGARYFF